MVWVGNCTFCNLERRDDKGAGVRICTLRSLYS